MHTGLANPENYLINTSDNFDTTDFVETRCEQTGFFFFFVTYGIQIMIPRDRGLKLKGYGVLVSCARLWLTEKIR